MSARPRFVRLVGGLTTLVLLGNAGAWYQLEVRADRAPSFDEGGEFLTELPVAGVDGRPYPYGDASALSTTTTPGAADADTVAEPGGPEATAGGVVPEATSGSDEGGGAPAPGAEPTVAPAADPLASPTPPRPAIGTYTYAVNGSEAATGFGSRRYPATASYVIHAGRSVPEGDLVHDLRLSGQHEERAIVRYGERGAAFTYEAGSITFGPGTQTSQGHYDPPMVQIPWPLAVGASASGTSRTDTRVETWTATVVGQEVLDVLGEQHLTWVVDVQRNTPAGSAEEVDRFRRYWYDPALGTWAQWTERFHGARQLLLTFTYDTTYTATLTRFDPA